MLRPSRWKFGGLLCMLSVYFYYLLCEWRFTVRIDGSKASCPQFDRALLDSSFSSLLLSLLILQITSVAFLFITSNERKLIIAKLEALDMPYDATKRDTDLKDELPCYANVVLLLFGGFFGRVLDFRGEKPGVPWAYVIAMPALRFLGESGILYAAVLKTFNNTIRIEYERGRVPPEPDYLGQDVVVARCARNETTPARFGNTREDIVHVNGWRVLHRTNQNRPWEVLSPKSNFVITLTTEHLKKVMEWGILPPKTLVKVPVTDIVPALRTAIAASNSFARSQTLLPDDEWRTLKPRTFGDAQKLCRDDRNRVIHQRAIVLNQQLLEADVDMLAAASFLIDLRLEAV